MLSGRYRDAENVLNRFINKYPDEPAGPFLKAAAFHYRCSDYEDFSREDEFMLLLEKTENLALRKLRLNGDDIWAQYYLAASASLRGAWTVANRNFIRGVLLARSGAHGMAEIISHDPSFYDAYLMHGSYNFWYSVAMKRFTWIPFIHTDINASINEVKTAISRGKLTGPLSTTILFEMFLEHDPEQAMKLGELMFAEYPSSRLFAWQLGEAYKKLHRYDDAVRLFTQLAESIARDKDDDGSGELRCWWKLAVLSKTLGKSSECVYYCNKVIELGKLESVCKRQEKRITQAQLLVKELTDE